MIIALVNQKGGVGKTTSVINIASSLHKMGKDVLVIDLDPQANATTGSGIEKNQLKYTVYNLLVDNISFDKIVTKTNCGYDLLPANRNLAGADIELVAIARREYRLRDALVDVKKYDVILLDCPPTLNLLTVNALAIARYLLVPIQCEYYALEGLTDLLATIEQINKGINSKLELLGIIKTMFDKRNNLANMVSNELEKYFKDRVFKTAIPRNIRLAEAPSFGNSAVNIDVNSTGAQAYINLTHELLNKINL